MVDNIIKLSQVSIINGPNNNSSNLVAIRRILAIKDRVLGKLQKRDSKTAEVYSTDLYVNPNWS